MTTTTAATTTLDLYPTTEAGEHHEYTFNGDGTTSHDAASYLLDFAKTNNLSLRHDPESDHTMTGWYVENADGQQLFAAIVK